MSIESNKVPIGSKIKLSKNKNCLLITIPLKNSDNDKFLATIRALIQAIFFIVIVLLISSFLTNGIEDKVVSIYLWLSYGIYYLPIALKNIYNIFGKMILKIDNEKIYLSYSFTTITVYQKSISKNNTIYLIEHTRYKRIPEFWYKKLVTVPSIIIKSGMNKIEIFHENISFLEHKWIREILAQQLKL